jgi:Condensation domain/TubC N-terminal docking domain
MIMKTAAEDAEPIRRFLARLRRLNLTVQSEDDRLRVSGPTGVLTSELRQELTERKAEILSFLRDVRDATKRPPIERVSRDQALPLSFAQERLWRNERHAASPDNVNVIVLNLKGALDVQSLERSFQELMRRHEIFRTTFHIVGDAPVQRIAPPRPFELSVYDLSQRSDAEAEAAGFALKEKTESFDFERGPLVRFSLLRLGPRHHRLVMRLHHILYDRWSLPILRRELNTLYSSFCLGKDSPLPEPTVQLADFAVWQRRYFEPNSSGFRSQLAYWKTQLSGNLPILRLPCERGSELKTAPWKAPSKSPQSCPRISGVLPIGKARHCSPRSSPP